MSKKLRVLKKIRNIAIAILIILTILVGTEIGYTWFMGRNSSLPSTETAESAITVTPAIKHVQQDDNVPTPQSVNGP